VSIRFFDTGIPPLKKGPSGAKKSTPSVAPNVWGWVDPLGLACKQTLPEFTSYSEFNKVFHSYGNRKFRRNLYFNEYKVYPDKFFSRDRVQGILKTQGYLPFTRGEVATDIYTNAMNKFIWLHSDAPIPSVIQYTTEFFYGQINDAHAPTIFDTPAGRKGALHSAYLGFISKPLLNLFRI
jgi:hypothetical protein